MVYSAGTQGHSAQLRCPQQKLNICPSQTQADSLCGLKHSSASLALIWGQYHCVVIIKDLFSWHPILCKSAGLNTLIFTIITSGRWCSSAKLSYTLLMVLTTLLICSQRIWVM